MKIILSYINPEQFAKLSEISIRWKNIANTLTNKSEMDCKNKFQQFMNILGR